MPKFFWILPVAIIAFYAVLIGSMIHSGQEAEERHQKGMAALVEMHLNGE
jgi:hypothetical protein